MEELQKAIEDNFRLIGDAAGRAVVDRGETSSMVESIDNYLDSIKIFSEGIVELRRHIDSAVMKGFREGSA